MKRQFKGWTVPGPPPAPTPEIPSDQSWDAISGSFRLFQYRDGHRFSTDDLLVAWFGTTHGIRGERILDLGSGIGTVASIVAWRLPGARLVTVEAQERSVALARRSAELNGLLERLEIRQGDFRSSVLSPEEKFDLVFGSPPYFPVTDGIVAENPQKAACRFEMRGHVGDYCQVAARHLAPGGMLFLVFPFDQESRVLDGIEDAGLALVRSQEVVFKEGEGSFLGLYQAMAREDLPDAFLRKLPREGVREKPLTIRLRNGEVSPEYSAVKLGIGFPP